MNYQDHPTWQMLEKSKQEYKVALDATPRFHHHRPIVEAAHKAIVTLQLALESRILREMSDEN